MMKNFINEFKNFAIKGNVIDLAVGVIIGGAFGKITASLVSDVITPLLGLMLGELDFKALYIGPVAIGNFIDATISFLLIAFVIFLSIKSINLLRKKSQKEEQKVIEKTSKEEIILSEIRDLLKNKTQ
jgi:large conductance mechanosensitive channel